MFRRNILLLVVIGVGNSLCLASPVALATRPAYLVQSLGGGHYREVIVTLQVTNKGLPPPLRQAMRPFVYLGLGVVAASTCANSLLSQIGLAVGLGAGFATAKSEDGAEGEILRGKIDIFNLDRLVSYAGKLYSSVQIKIIAV